MLPTVGHEFNGRDFSRVLGDSYEKADLGMFHKAVNFHHNPALYDFEKCDYNGNSRGAENLG